MTLAWARGKGRASPKPDSDAPVWPVLAELEVYTATRRLIGWIAPEGERTSDWINKSNEVELVGAVETGLAEPRPELQQPGAGAVRVRVPISEIVFAVPPSLPQERHLRLHRRVLHVRFQMEGYELSGRIHIRPGAEVGEYLLRSSRIFVPITDAELVHQRDPQFQRLLPVVIMNARHVSRIHLVDGQPEPPALLAEPRSAEPPAVARPTVEVPAAGTGAAAPTFTFNDIEPMAGSVHRALSELTALHRDGLINEAEFDAKRAEILGRL
jgi:uncharacterized protein DUF6812